MADTQIRVQELNGIWSAIGSGKAAGIVVSDGSLGADQWGSREATFTLKRNPRAIWPDISAYTPVEVEIGGVLVWSGRVKDTPTRDGDDRQMTVNCEGWQFHLDDDVYQKMYVMADMTKWQDVRTHPGADLGAGNFSAQGTVSADSTGAIYLGTPNGAPITAGQRVGVYLDLGANCTAYGVSFDFTSSNNTANDYLYVRGQTYALFGTSDSGASSSDALAGYVNSGHPGSRVNASFATPKRYICIFNYTTPGYTPGADVWWRITSLRVFTSSSYGNTLPAAGASNTTAAPVGNSALLASQVVTDAITSATLLLSADTTKIATSTFAIPDFSLSGYTTPREVINAANTFEGYQARVLVDKRMEYRQKPITTGVIAYQVDDGSGATFEDASANSGEQIYSGVVVEASGSDGLPLALECRQSSASVLAAKLPLYYHLSDIQFFNGDFESSLVAWTNSTWSGAAVTFSRDTGQHNTGVAAMKLAFSGLGVSSSITDGGNMVPFTLSGPTGFVPGRKYRMTYALRTDTALTVGVPAAITGSVLLIGRYNPATGVAYDGWLLSTAIASPTLNTWTTYTNDFELPAAGNVAIYLHVGLGGAGNVWLDSFEFYEVAPTIVQRREIRRTFVLNTNMGLTSTSAQQLGDIFLSQHVTTPLKGGLTVSTNKGIKRALGGNAVPPCELLLNTGEQMLFPHLTNPDTGDVGRTGVIDAVTYDINSGIASVQIDNQRSNFDSLLSRLAIVTGQVR